MMYKRRLMRVNRYVNILIIEEKNLLYIVFNVKFKLWFCLFYCLIVEYCIGVCECM